MESLYSSYTQHLRAALADLDDDMLLAAAETMQRLAQAITEVNQVVRRTNSTGD